MPVKKKASRAWQRMLSGRRLDLLDPSPLDIEIEDIAHGLARMPRWNGQTIGAYPFSVAQHSLLVCDLVDVLSANPLQSAQLTTLLHDAPEYVISDLITPFKQAIGADYKIIEQGLSRAIFLRFGLPATVPAILRRLIKQADGLAASLEARHLAGFSTKDADQIFGKLPVLPSFDLSPWPTETAEFGFLKRFHDLYGPA